MTRKLAVYHVGLKTYLNKYLPPALLMVRGWLAWRTDLDNRAKKIVRRVGRTLAEPSNNNNLTHPSIGEESVGLVEEVPRPTVGLPTCLDGSIRLAILSLKLYPNWTQHYTPTSFYGEA
ncbi:hypothetical protein Pmani_027250 [Petrolisthes manimaculis]|uniref:Uncharacterized protein n=2 Tax=Petrolisthes TaxID=84661 RepID=A0AAE1P1Z5_9EUCA|nr:hypothetical protein Pcinc_042961 [Petrolisthes cinctipes]KAK4300549.1 hypothetical protein Pmani_027250 [Petrolisthes manimaculis]